MPNHEKQKTCESSERKVYIRTFGCQMNSRDSEFIAGLFIDKGYKISDSPKEANVILSNTCSVREHAEERAIHNMRQLMHKYKDRIYGIIGCGAQALKDELFIKLPKLNIVCGTGEITKLPELVEKAFEEKVLAVKDLDLSLPELMPSYRENKTHAYVSIMRGCNNFCSYCIVPYVRGRERSRRVGDIVKEIKSLAKMNIKNITLLGQNVNSYKDEEYDFVKLLKAINEIDGISKIDFFTSHPKDANSNLFKAMRDLDKVIKHLHLPLQSGSDKILKLMRRGYTKAKYTKLISSARKIIPSLHITTDVIVGFPGETEKDFKDTLNLLKNVKFNAAYLFKYSPRPGTQASKMEDDVTKEIKKKRHKTLLDFQRKIHSERSK